MEQPTLPRSLRTGTRSATTRIDIQTNVSLPAKLKQGATARAPEPKSDLLTSVGRQPLRRSEVLLQEPGPPQHFDRSPPRNVVTVEWVYWHLSASLGLIQRPAARRVPTGSGAELPSGGHLGEALCS
jgi:hypothetical protein